MSQDAWSLDVGIDDDLEPYQAISTTLRYKDKSSLRVKEPGQQSEPRTESNSNSQQHYRFQRDDTGTSRSSSAYSIASTSSSTPSRDAVTSTLELSTTNCTDVKGARTIYPRSSGLAPKGLLAVGRVVEREIMIPGSPSQLVDCSQKIQGRGPTPHLVAPTTNHSRSISQDVSAWAFYHGPSCPAPNNIVVAGRETERANIIQAIYAEWAECKQDHECQTETVSRDDSSHHAKEATEQPPVQEYKEGAHTDDFQNWAVERECIMREWAEFECERERERKRDEDEKQDMAASLMRSQEALHEVHI